MLDAVDGVVGDAREHVAQVRFGIDVVQLGRAEQAVDSGGAFAAGVGAREQVIFATQRDYAQRSFRGVMPRAGLCRVRAGSESVLGGSRVFWARDIGITTGSPRMQAMDR